MKIWIQNEKLNEILEDLTLEKAAKSMDCVDDDNQDEYEDDEIRSGAWLIALL
jgi:hypothetical protein